MPHIIIEWTDNLAEAFAIKALMDMMATHMRDSGGVFPTGGIRVRGIRLADYVIADGEADDAFVNITIKIGAGRPAEFKRTFFAALFEKVEAFFAEIHACRYLALSMYIEEFDEQGGYKRNNLHSRFQKVG